MRPLAIRGIDVLAVAGAVAAIGVAVFYLSIIDEQDSGGPAVWFVALLGVAALLCLVAAPLRLPGRAGVLLAAAFLTGGLGVLAILSIGGLLLLVGLLPGVAFLLDVLQPDDGRSAR
jgi:hypothetical protein